MNNRKILVICLIICFVFSLQAVAASDVDNQNVTLSDSDMSVNADVLTETNVNSDLKEFNTYNMGNKFGSIYSGETSNVIDSNNEVLKADNSEVLSAEIHVDGNSFDDIATVIENSDNGDIIFLNGGTYTGTGTEITIDKEITIIGGSSLTDSSFATLDANQKSRIFNVIADNVIIKNINFVNGSASEGGAVYWNGNYGTLSDSNFNMNRGGKGCSVYWNGKNGNLTNSNFINILGASNGGAIFWNGINGSVSYSNFSNDMKPTYLASGYGGAIFWEYGGTDGSLFECNFVNITAAYGGAVRWVAQAGNISDCNFTNNGGTYGGAVSFNSIKGTVDNCNFMENTALAFGGALHTDAGEVNVTSCTFFNNSANQQGGAFYTTSYKGILKNSTFINNSAGVKKAATGAFIDGGAIMWDAWYGTVINCSFINNTADNRGGAIFNDGAQFSVINSSFVNNSALGNPVQGSLQHGAGGAIFWLAAMGDEGGIFNSSFINNTANGRAGAIYDGVHDFRVFNSSFINNTAEIDGGAILLDHTLSKIWNSSFINNSAVNNGGAIWISHSYHEVDNSSFLNNRAENGGAIFIKDECTEEDSIHGSNFTNNTAVKGGAVYYFEWADNGKLYDSIFMNNTAKEDGGAVYWNGNDGKLWNSTFIYNNATNRGGAVYWTPSPGRYSFWDYPYYDQHGGTLDNSTFVNNTADYGGAVYWDDFVGVINNSDYINNTANYYGGAIYWYYPHSYVSSKMNWDNSNGLVNASNFYHNKARNGSAIYSEKDFLSIEKVHFDENQAWSYLLFVDAIPKISVYNTEDISITVQHFACDNIINGIWNNVSVDSIRLLNCSYVHSIDGEIYTNPTEYEYPVDGVENSITRTRMVTPAIKLYQDNREYLQLIDVNITDENGNLWYSVTGLQTDIYGKVYITIPKATVRAGNNTVVGMHPEDWNYKIIKNESWFMVIKKEADLEVIKENDHVKITDGKEVIDICRKGDIVYWTITVINHGPDEAINAVLKDVLPKGLRYISDDSQGKYDKDKGIWKLGDMPVGDTRTLVIKTEVLLSNATILNLAVVSSDTPDPNETNNKDNSSVPVLPIIDLEIIKIVDKTDVFVGDKVTFTITVINHGPDTAVNTRMTDVLPKGLKLVSFKVSRGSFDSATGIWSIGDLKPGESVQMFIVAEALITGHIINNASVISDTPEEDLSNNNDSAAIDVREIPENHTVPPKDNHTVTPVKAVDSVPKLHATGNPILMVLMALCVMIGTTIRRKNL